MCYRIDNHDITEYGTLDDFSTQYHQFAFDFPKVPIVTNDGKLHLTSWGLIPSWVKDKTQAEQIRDNTANARAETVSEKPSFRNSIKMGRTCIIPVNGFFEHMEFKGKNYPHYIHLKDRKAFGLAGIWDIWIDKNTGEEINSFSILTCDANELMAKVHNKKKRMPVILEKGEEKQWLQKAELSLLDQYPAEQMEAYTVSRLLTNKNENKNVPEVSKSCNYPELSIQQIDLF